MTAHLRGPLLAAASLALVVGAAGPARAQLGLGALLPGGGFTVDGRRGTYLSQVDPTRIDNRILQQEAQGLSAEGNSIAAFDGLRLPMPKTQQALDALVARVDGPWPHDRPTTPRAHLIANGEYAPQTLPDGSIMVSMGLLLQAETDDEVAFILAHELGHVRLGHFADDGAFRRKRQFVTMFGRLYHAVIALSEARIFERGDRYEIKIQDERRVNEERVRTAAANAALRQLMTLLLERPWSRAEEDRADALAYDLTAQSGLRPGAAATSVFSRLDAEYDLKVEASRHIEQTVSVAVRGALTEENIRATVDGRSEDAWARLRGPLMRAGRESLMQVAIGYLGQRHRTPEARTRGIGEYAARAYPGGSPTPEPQTDWLDDVRALPEFQEARTVVVALQAAKGLEATDKPAALAALRPALTTRFRATPVVANAAARLHGLSGNINEADRLYTVAHRSPDQSLEAYVDHAQLMVDDRRFERAQAVVTLGVAHAGEGVDGEKPFLPVLVDAAFRQRKHDEGLILLRRCVAYEEDDLRTSCVNAAMGYREGGEELPPERQAQVNAARRDAEAQSTLGGDVEGVIRGIGNLFSGGGRQE